MIDNIYNVYNKRPPPAPISVAASEAQVPLGGMAKGPGGGYGAADLRPWYVAVWAGEASFTSGARVEQVFGIGLFCALLGTGCCNGKGSDRPVL